jgi:glutamate carboxypeptidase
VLQGERFRREGAQAYGSGASDMKGGDVIIVEALRALAAASALDGRPITVIMTGDEENPGAPLDATRDPLREAARNADVVLAFEGSSAGVAAIGRRGNATWQLTTTGKQAHSSQIFRADLGDGAIFEAARILERFHRELREPYLTYNPAVIVGGTDVEFDEASHGGAAHGKDNVIPRETRVTGDLRFISAEQFEKASARMRAIVAEHLPGTGATIEVQLRYPSMTPSDANRGVLAVLDAVSSDLGDGPIVAEDPLNRGAGDISFVCNDGRKACLDGLGATGEQEHAPGEWVDLDQMPKMTKRTALLLHRLAK